MKERRNKEFLIYNKDFPENSVKVSKLTIGSLSTVRLSLSLSVWFRHVKSVCFTDFLNVLCGSEKVRVLYGDIEEAICSHALYYSLWKHFGVLPERWNWQSLFADVTFYPLRPELVESTYLLYQVCFET
uniref:Uncharacterized protein n=1 Tax=Timema douglasi TaxID=61478 RepID=A0A7R8Z5S7_TIMDO|nr:unnamed protein product [Timema douglasi]